MRYLIAAACVLFGALCWGASAPAVAPCSGDAEAGEFALDESADGVTISATWVGSVEPNACGREIRGRWLDTLKKTELDFVLRKLPENSR